MAGLEGSITFTKWMELRLSQFILSITKIHFIYKIMICKSNFQDNIDITSQNNKHGVDPPC